MLRKSSAGCSLTNLWQMLFVNATSRIFFFLHPKSNPVDGLCVGGPGVFACSSLQMSAGDMICHADSQPAVGLITTGQPNAWPSSGRGPGSGSGGSIIHLHPCLCIMAASCDRWPVYLWSPATTKPDTHTHTDAHNYTTKGLLWRPGNTQRSSGNTLGHTLTHKSIIQAWLDVWCIVQIHCSHSAEMLECLPVQTFFLINNTTYRLWKDSWWFLDSESLPGAHFIAYISSCKHRVTQTHCLNNLCIF